jgi:CRP/FNR family transcriptional regulator
LHGAGKLWGVMLTPYEFAIVESCVGCNIRPAHGFCDLPQSAVERLDQIKHAMTYPKGALLFVQGQPPRGMFVLCKGRVKLWMSSRDGKTLIARVADAGEVLGMGACITGRAYELTAETVEPSQITFVRRDDSLLFIREHSEACLRVSEMLSEKYHSTCEILTAALSYSAPEKLVKLLLEWTARDGQGDKQKPHLKLNFTNEELGQMIGSSRETVTRLVAELRKRQIVQIKGSTLIIRDKAALKSFGNIAGEDVASA